MMRVLLAFPIALLLAFSGCIGGSEPQAQPSPSINPTSDVGTPAPTGGLDNDTPVPKYHPHNNWGTRTDYALFEAFAIDLGQDAAREFRYKTDRVIIGYREFDTRIDGDDSRSPTKADTILQGTRAIKVKLEWVNEPPASNLPGVTFYFKPGNSRDFQPVEAITSGAEFEIPVLSGQADMPHNLALSRWRFALEAYDAQTAGLPVAPSVAKGQVMVTMTILKGDADTIDRPHPYYFLTHDELPAGDINKTLNSKVVNATTPPTTNGDPLNGWEAPALYIIPWETTMVRAELHYNYTGSASAIPHKLGLRYTDASGPTEKYPALVREDAGVAVYEFPIQSNEADDPYAVRSQWTWGVYPIVNDQKDLGGDFEGDVHLVLTAIGKSTLSE